MPDDKTDTLLTKIDSIDWCEFDGPSMYSAESARQALRSLVNINGAGFGEAVSNELLSSIGNNHAGVYYPAVLAAIDLILEVAKDPENEPRQICALAILNDLFYFEPEIGTYSDVSKERLKSLVETKLDPYSDDRWERHRLF